MSNWETRAACRNFLDDSWCPGAGAKRKGVVADAVFICRNQCPVQADCAHFAQQTKKSTGIWGGVDLGYEPSKKPEPEVREQLRRVADGV